MYFMKKLNKLMIATIVYALCCSGNIHGHTTYDLTALDGVSATAMAFDANCNVQFYPY
jgi:hypothetical protein